MAVDAQLLKSIRARKSRRGVLTADRYFRAIEGCFEGGFCPVKLFEKGTDRQWKRALKEASCQLTYSTDRTIVLPESIKGITDAPKSLMEFSAVITTSRVDRDKDILETKGASLDPAAPLLWQHIPLQPIGKLIRQLEKTKNRLTGQFAIADTELGRDAATLVEMGALRISHGFDPDEYEPREDVEEGWLFKGFEIYEVSLVSVPSNKDAVITAWSRSALKSGLIGGWAKSIHDKRPVQGIGFDPPVEESSECSCHKGAEQVETPEAVEPAEVKAVDNDSNEVPDADEQLDMLGHCKAAHTCAAEMCGMDGEHKPYAEKCRGHLAKALEMYKPEEKSFSELALKVKQAASQASHAELTGLVLSLSGWRDLLEAREVASERQALSAELGLP